MFLHSKNPSEPSSPASSPHYLDRCQESSSHHLIILQNLSDFSTLTLHKANIGRNVVGSTYPFLHLQCTPVCPPDNSCTYRQNYRQYCICQLLIAIFMSLSAKIPVLLSPLARYTKPLISTIVTTTQLDPLFANHNIVGVTGSGSSFSNRFLPEPPLKITGVYLPTAATVFTINYCLHRACDDGGTSRHWYSTSGAVRVIYGRRIEE